MWIYYRLFLPTNQKSRENAIPVRHLFWSVNVIGQQSLFRLNTDIRYMVFRVSHTAFTSTLTIYFPTALFISFHFLFCFVDQSFKLQTFFVYKNTRFQ